MQTTQKATRSPKKWRKVSINLTGIQSQWLSYHNRRKRHHLFLWHYRKIRLQKTKVSGKSTGMRLKESPKANASEQATSSKQQIIRIYAIIALSIAMKSSKRNVQNSGTLQGYLKLKQVRLKFGNYLDSYLKEARKIWP